MTWLAVWLVGVGVADLTRAASGYSRGRWPVVAGTAGVAVPAVLAGLTAPVDVVVLATSLVALGLWVRFSAQALVTGTGHGPALAALALGGTWLVGLSGWATPAGGVLARWLAWADPPLLDEATDPGAVLLVLGLLLVNLTTANLVVRLVLLAVGAMRPVRPLEADTGPQPSDQLRGGRLLGPMERVLILGLGLAGQLTAAGLVIAAKGLIRFPELQAKRDDRSSVDGVGIDAVTEYFLVGSFVSWLIALTSLALTR
ncbi:hypothetical protein GCM10023168_21180 [Fodinibacter luteus]|uniref:Uncharacterized protein n=1 Tax=Fodinibacter luteus TaxID=552064 RepID=A0ABP8KGR8_9MICO